MHVQRQGTAAHGRLNGQLLEQPASDSAPSSAFSHRHCDLWNWLTSLIKDERRFVGVQPGGAHAIPAIVNSQQRQVSRLREQRQDRRIVRGRQRPVVEAAGQPRHLRNELAIEVLGSADPHVQTVKVPDRHRFEYVDALLLLDESGSPVLRELRGAGARNRAAVVAALAGE